MPTICPPTIHPLTSTAHPKSAVFVCRSSEVVDLFASQTVICSNTAIRAKGQNMKKTLLAFAAVTMVATSTPALADPPPWAPAHGKRYKDRDDRNDRYRDRDRRGTYDSRGRYYEPRRITRNSRVWRGDNGRYYCRRDNGTTGLLIGAGVGALAGHEIAGRGDRTLGAIIGAVGGGLLGREIDRGSLSCR